MIAPSGEQIEIALGDHRAVVVEVGGGLRVDGYGPDEMCASGRGQGLIPWPNGFEATAGVVGGQSAGARIASSLS